MRTNPFIISSILFLALTVTGANHADSAATVSPPAVGQSSPALWKATPEDSASWRREPFKSPESQKQTTGPSTKQESSDISLQGIMKGNKRYYAIINGRTVKPGDHIESWTVAAISRYRVTIRRESETQIYDIYQGKIDRGTR